MVNARMQGQGIGSRILSDVCDALGRQGFKAVTVGIRRLNTEAESFWRSNGFEDSKLPQAFPDDPEIRLLFKAL